VLISSADAAAYRRLFASVNGVDYQLSSEPPKVPEASVTSIHIDPILIRPLSDSEEPGVLQ
jgi:hypothetical protein